MKIIIFGCQQISVDVIKYLQKRTDIYIPMIITSESSTDVTYGYQSVINLFKNSNVDVRNIHFISDELIEEIRTIQPDLILSLYYRSIFPKSLLAIPHLGCINVHPSLLPAYRGPAPTAWSILNNEKETGITIHLMNEGVDTGDILFQENSHIYENETGFELHNRMMKLGADILINRFDDVLNRNIQPKKQPNGGSYFGKKASRCMINWQERCMNIKNLVRVHSSPYNRAETLLFNHQVLVNHVDILNGYPAVIQKPGGIMEVRSNGDLIISCVDGYISMKEYEIIPALSTSQKEAYLKAGNYFNSSS